jgi:hypothetical protein
MDESINLECLLCVAPELVRIQSIHTNKRVVFNLHKEHKLTYFPSDSRPLTIAGKKRKFSSYSSEYVKLGTERKIDVDLEDFWFFRFRDLPTVGYIL